MVAALVLSGCSNNESSSGTSEDNSSNGGGTLVFGRGADAVSLDPINVTDGESIRSTNNIYETLFTYDNNLKLQPKLAMGYETSEDGLTWTIKLRDDVKFHDGTKFNADAVVFNFDRWMDKENPYHQGGDFVYYSFLYGGFKGDENHLIESVKAIDETTVEFKLKEKTAPFISYLAIPMFGIASPDAIKKYNEKFNEHPVGTGPFKFKEWKRNDTVTLEKNEDYYVDGKPELDRLIFKVIPDNTARLTALQTGEIDMMDGLDPSKADSVKNNESLDLIERPSFNIGYLAFNMEKEPFNDVKVRKAINYAIDRKAIVDAFYSGLGEVAKNPLPPSLWGYNDNVEGYELDIEKAKKLLKEAGYEDGFKTQLWTMSNPRPYLPQPQKIAEALQSDLSKIGIEVEIVTYEWATYLDKTSQGGHPMALFGWTGVMADPDNFLFPNLDKSNAEVPANNRAFYKSEEVHQLLVKARQTLDQEKRADIYKEVQEILYKDAPWANLVHTTPPLAKAKYVEGFKAHPMNDDLFTNVTLSK
ncbi:ABC transporter substrate-binding protein [Pseudalkalibacillus caeni]|uniref:ABC transporter substrate-binding protein n=1 Tax=Exobacillus caeni TaxID=2574798 RepID=A0A5R9FBJ6_9BACL|nr:ABC transporter substrate-binding protein [Pseudalkalibacillus caeni]TLS36995.1 ABC transporter substrate-binding protein [Pseudalkalibacillus caeni]